MAEKGLGGIRRRIRLELKLGKAIGFVGWRDSYHDDFTRSIPPEKVVFTRSEAPPTHVGFIFFTGMVNATQRGRIANKRPVMNVPLEPDEIKSLLKEFASLLAPPVREARHAPQAHATDTHDDILDWLTRPQELGIMETFTQAFQAEAAKNNGRVSSRALKKLTGEHKTMSLYRLIGEGWIVPEKAQGKTKVGWYRAGMKMVELEEQATILPDDPIERARFKIARKNSLIAEKDRLEGQVAEIKAELGLIQKIEDAMSALGDLVKK